MASSFVEFEVVYSLWGAEGVDDPFDGGVHRVEDPPVELVRSVASAASGPVPVVRLLDASADVRKILDGTVESQKDSEAAQTQAQADGTWQEGNLQQYVLENAALLTGDALEGGETLSDADLGWRLAGLVDAYTRLERADEAATASARLAEVQERQVVAPTPEPDGGGEEA